MNAGDYAVCQESIRDPFSSAPVKALFENLESGATVEDFLGWFPGVKREQVEAVLDHAQRSLVEA
jgi:uncharacterized protein (DUF433 family)